MKKYFLLTACVLLLAACSTPKYAYYFDHYDYNSGRKSVEKPGTDINQIALSTPDFSPLRLDEQAVTANANSRVKEVARSIASNPDMAKEKAALQKKYSSLSKAEKKEFRKDLKSVVKKAIKAKKEGKSIESIDEVKAMDHDLKMALIFAVVAIVLGAFWGANSVFGVLSLISLVIAIVFFIQWIARQ